MPGSNGGAAPFEAFLGGWLVRQEHYLDELLCAEQRCHEAKEEYLRDLIARVLAHYQQFYEEKSRIARQDIFLVFSPTWLSSFERSFLWIAGFKPALAFRVLDGSVTDLSPHQCMRINMLVEVTRIEEKTLNDELAKIQESVAAPPLLELARRRAMLMEEGGVEEADAALEQLKSSMEAVVLSADMLRTRTVAKVVEILNPVQCVKFLVAIAQLQLSIRSWGVSLGGDD